MQARQIAVEQGVELDMSVSVTSKSCDTDTTITAVLGCVRAYVRYNVLDSNIWFMPNKQPSYGDVLLTQIFCLV